MGKTSKPLRLLVHMSLMEYPEVRDLKTKGHTIEMYGSQACQYDLILGPNIWRMDADLLKYLDIAIAAARSTKYSKDKPSES